MDLNDRIFDIDIFKRRNKLLLRIELEPYIFGEIENISLEFPVPQIPHSSILLSLFLEGEFRSYKLETPEYILKFIQHQNRIKIKLKYEDETYSLLLTENETRKVEVNLETLRNLLPRFTRKDYEQVFERSRQNL